MKSSILKSSIPGLVEFPARFNKIPTGEGWVEGRRGVDGAEGLWRVNDGLYDLTNFVETHPGGSEWLTITKGTDITELFESHHLTDKAEKLLPKFYIRDAVKPRAVPLTFDKNGFYKKFKERSMNALKNIDFHRPSLKSNLLADSLAITTLFLCVITATTQSRLALIIAGTSMTLATITGHNYFHMRDNFRMYYWDISLMSSREWRITHAMSHHMYPNTIWDYEILTFEPYFQYLPKIAAPISRKFSWLYSPLVYLLAFYSQGIKRYIHILLVRKKLEFRDVVPFIIPTVMFLATGDLQQIFKQWILIIGVASFVFHVIGLNAAHHHPDIFHDGDNPRNDLDWGLLEMDAVRDREIVDDSYFLTLTQFGLHSLHHLMPTVDHAYLHLCLPALEDTCREFGIGTRRFTPLELIKGQFRQLRRVQVKTNYR
ncbi:cytochrome b5-related protein isoform X3 [Fopius arisanus]|uniref:Cytochrome b5-related protein n=2 Tax=Fopius arisanus TaxID=64838 RepID=A0A9R1TDZ0_9HYME|nr:PREDICTED: cytochrome b5-related protein isoform X3 [Fopius arisanus]